MEHGETLSLVVKLETIFIVLSIVVSQSWPIHQLSKKNVFLHENLHKMVYIRRPMGYVTQNVILCVSVEEVIIWIKSSTMVMEQKICRLCLWYVILSHLS